MSEDELKKFFKEKRIAERKKESLLKEVKEEL
jgi:hypothetical protein